MRPQRILLLAASLLALAIPASAMAAPGDLIGQTCIAKAGAGGCAVLPEPNALEFANGVAVAPDGTDVYVGAGAGIAHFRRAPDGSLTYANCVDTSSSIGDRCPTADAPADGNGALSANAINIAISPDGEDLYAVSWADSLAWWKRDPASGNLTWGDCWDGSETAATNGHCGTATTFGGGNFPADSMDFTQGIAVTPDGKSIFIADQTGGLLQAQRNTSTGVATPTACFDTTGSAAAGCTTTAADVPMALSGIDVGSNSRDVYVRSISPGGITHFRRTAGGTTSFASCVANVAPSASCPTAAPAPVFQYSGSIGVSADLVFTHGGNYGGIGGTPPPSGTVARFARDADGMLAFQGCASTEVALGPCSALPAETSAGSIGRLLVSPDGASVFLPQVGNAERALTRVSSSLSFLSCLSDTGVAACSPPPLPTAFSQPVGQMVFSPDGKQVYQAGQDMIETFSVEQAGGPSGATGSTPVSSGKPRAKAPKIKSVKPGKKGRYLVTVKTRQAGTITAKLRGKLKPKGKAVKLGKTASRRATKAGTYVLTLKPPKAARERKVKARLTVTLSAPGFLPAQAGKFLKLK
jgi:hypothetical protein